MDITEKDLYKFVFYNSELSVDKQNFIRDNLDKFSSSIELLSEMKSQLEMEVSPIIMGRIYDLIADQYPKEEFVLSPVNIENSHDYNILAADSTPIECNNLTQTFSDRGNNYLVKVVSEESQDKLFLFPKDRKINSVLSLTIYPSNEEYLLDKNSSSYLLLKKQKIDKIVIKK